MKEEMFVLVEASKLSLDDEFMRHVPKTPEECKLKTQLETVIERGIANFYRPRMDPAFDGTYNIFFNSGLKPAVGRNGYWWLTNAKKYAPERKSRLGTNSEYIAFLGVLIKMLIVSSLSGRLKNTIFKISLASINDKMERHISLMLPLTVDVMMLFDFLNIVSGYLVTGREFTKYSVKNGLKSF